MVAHMNAAPSQALSNSYTHTDGLEFLWIELTNKCNLQCVHCYADSGPHSPLSEGLTIGDYKRVLEEAFLHGCSGVQFIGGEPLIYPGIKELVLYAHSLGYKLIEVYTNGMLLSDTICRTFSELGVQVAVSVYANQDEIHDTITKRRGSFDRTINGIKTAVKHSVPVRVGVIVMQENEAVADATEQFLTSLGAYKVGVDRMRGIGRGSSGAPSADPMSQLCGACWQGKLAVTPNGDVFPCVFSRFHKVGNIQEGIGAILQSDRLRSFRSAVHAQTAGDCTPDTSCNPPPTCSPDRCSPDMGCEPQNKCSPASKCHPDKSCFPDRSCTPDKKK